MKKLITGIQQIGIGIPDVHQAWKWYRQHFGMDVPVFEEAAEANLMLPYTGGKPHKRHAVLAINLKGGGGFEIWQYTSRKPVPAPTKIYAGDLGIFAAKVKAVDVNAAFNMLKSKGADLVGPVRKDPAGNLNFFVRDPYGNHFQIIQGRDWFKNENKLTGGAAGAVIGVSDMNRSIKFYKEVLGYDKVIYDKEGNFDDLNGLDGGQLNMHRVLLRPSAPRKGSFSRLLGSDEVELIKANERAPHKIFKDRYWGDLGFIHLCYDVKGMDELRKDCEAKGHPFTVDSGANSFDMGEAAGRFSYIEDPDGTLIEFVETHKIPILKKFGWYLNVKDKDPEKPLADWMLKLLSLTRKKD